jgi:hypothetical protein
MNDALVFSVLARQGRTPPIEDRHIVEKVSKEAELKKLTDEEKLLHAEEREARQKQNEKNRKDKKKRAEQHLSENEQVLMDDSEPEKLFDRTGHLPEDPDPEHRIKHVDDYV